MKTVFVFIILSLYVSSTIQQAEEVKLSDKDDEQPERKLILVKKQSVSPIYSSQYPYNVAPSSAYSPYNTLPLPYGSMTYPSNNIGMYPPGYGSGVTTTGYGIGIGGSLGLNDRIGGYASLGLPSIRPKISAYKRTYKMQYPISYKSYDVRHINDYADDI